MNEEGDSKLGIYANYINSSECYLLPILGPSDCEKDLEDDMNHEIYHQDNVYTEADEGAEVPEDAYQEEIAGEDSEEPHVEYAHFISQGEPKS